MKWGCVWRVARGACPARLLTWKAMSTRSEIMNAALRLEKPVEQKDDGIVLVDVVVTVLLLAAWACGDEDHGSPPLSHSH